MNDVEISNDLKVIYTKAIQQLGIENQTTIAIEECGELIQAITKYKRNKYDKENMSMEMAHVKLMLEQLLVLFDNYDLVQEYYNEALERLRGLIK